MAFGVFSFLRQKGDYFCLWRIHKGCWFIHTDLHFCCLQDPHCCARCPTEQCGGWFSSLISYLNNFAGKGIRNVKLLVGRIENKLLYLYFWYFISSTNAENVERARNSEGLEKTKLKDISLQFQKRPTNLWVFFWWQCRPFLEKNNTVSLPDEEEKTTSRILQLESYFID